MRGQLVKNVFRWGVSVSEDTAIKFITRNFDLNKAALATDDCFENFRALVRDDEAILAAKEYEQVTGASHHECHLATIFAKKLKQPPS